MVVAQNEDELLTPLEVARRLGVSLSTLNRYAADKGLPVYRLSLHTHRYRWAEVELWLAQRGR